MKCVILRSSLVHAIQTEWPSEPFVAVADNEPCQVGWVHQDGKFYAPGSAEAIRIAANAATIDAMIVAALDELRGMRIQDMTAAQQRKLLAIVCRKLGIEVRP